MEIRSYNKNELQEFIYSNKFYELKNIPISRHRALSQIKNPRAGDEDILLIVAYDDDRTVGYFGILPDLVYVNGIEEKIGWGSCFWVDEDYKSQNVAASIFLRVIRAWKQRLFITNIVPFLEPVYQKTGIFHPTRYKTGLRAYCRFNLSEILPPKKKLFKKLKPLLTSADNFGNLGQDLRLKTFGSVTIKGIKPEYVWEIDASVNDFISEKNKHELIRRGKKEYDWITHNPWILEGGELDMNRERYYFSAYSHRFFYQHVCFRGEKNELVGFALLSVRNNNLTIPCYYGDYKIHGEVIRFLFNYMKELNLNMITVFNEALKDALSKSKLPFLMKKEIKRPYLLSKRIDARELNFQDGDGDGIFT